MLITGASSGIGRATALAFAAERTHGATRLILVSRSAEALADVARECRDRGADVLVAPADITDPDAVGTLAEHRIDVWVEAVAVGVAGPLGSEPVAELRRLVEVNVFGTALCARAAMGVFRRQEHGTLIIVGSLLSLFPNPMIPLYSMSKFAIRGLALNLQQEVARHRRIKVCLVLPGPVDTPFFVRAANHTGRRLRAIPPAYAPERLAATIVGCARRPRRQVTTGVVGHLALVAHRIAPHATETAVAWWSATLLTGPQPAASGPGALFEPPSSGAVHGGHRRGRLRRRFGQWLGRAGT
ncbi:SDR family oxidoreductase [Actinoplanes couchii]